MVLQLKLMFRKSAVNCDKEELAVLSNHVILRLLPPLDWYGKGVFDMELLLSLIIAVVASVISHLICKWLDSDE